VKSKDLRLLLSMGSSRKLLFGAIVGALVNTATVIGNAFLIAAIIVGLIYSHPSVASHILLLALLWGFRAVFTSQFDRWASGEAAALKAELRSQVLYSSESVTAIPSSQLTMLLIKGANSLDIYLARFLPQIFGASFTPLAVIIAIAILDPTSALIALFTLPLIPVFGALIGKYTSDAVTAKWKSLGTLSKYFEDSLRGIYTLAIFGRHKSQGSRIEEMGNRYTDETMKVLRISFLSALVLELAATISVALIAVSIGIRLVNSSMEFFPALAVLVLAPEVYFPLRNAASLFHASADGGAALGELNELTAKKSTTAQGAEAISKVDSLDWDSWSSPFGRGSLGSHALKSGEVLVLRGGSGLGKTTFLNSLLGLNASSTARVNGVATKKIERSSLFRQVGWIPQSPSLISGSIGDLFTLVRPEITNEEIEKVLARVGLTIDSLPDGLETVIGGLGEKSGHLSGGQKRRIAIARAIAINPSLIIADEPTADLDPSSAQEILNLLRAQAAGGAIVIAVLHAPDQVIPGAREEVMVEG
jgi:ABC-type transport system involved in cytochrome bd biosynthesis fused ATPase/permease subunit